MTRKKKNEEPAAIWLDPKELRELEGSPNPRENENAISPVGQSIERFGFLAPIVARRSDGAIAAGHTRWKASLARGEERVRVVLVDFESDEELRAYRLADNGLGVLATWSKEGLRDEVRQLAEKELDLSGLGWTQEELAHLLHKRTSFTGGTGPVETPELQDEPSSEVGTVYELGPHRLAVGDSTDLDHVRGFMGGELARCVFTDPPFAMYGSSTGVDGEVTDDKIVRPFFRSTLRAVEVVLELTGVAFVCCDWRSWPSWWEVSKATNLDPKNLLTWKKPGTGMGSNFGNSTENIGYFAKAGKKELMTDGRPNGIRPVHLPNYLGEFNRPQGRARFHNAQKPGGLVRHCLEAATDRGELVVDLFGGSGTTLLEGHRIGRRVFLSEVDPKWADLIRRRWTALAEELGEDPGPGALHG